MPDIDPAPKTEAPAPGLPEMVEQTDRWLVAPRESRIGAFARWVRAVLATVAGR